MLNDALANLISDVCSIERARVQDGTKLCAILSEQQIAQLADAIKTRFSVTLAPDAFVGTSVSELASAVGVELDALDDGCPHTFM